MASDYMEIVIIIKLLLRQYPWKESSSVVPCAPLGSGAVGQPHSPGTIQHSSTNEPKYQTSNGLKHKSGFLQCNELPTTITEYYQLQL